MADFQPVNEADLAPPQPPQGSYEPVNDNDLAAPQGQMPPMRGIKGMPSYSPGVMARLRDGDPVTRIIGAAAKGAADGFGSGAPGADAYDSLVKAGVFPSREDIDHPSAAGTLRFFNQSLLQPAISLGDAFLRLFPAAVEATHQGVTQAATEAGAENPEAIGREAGGDLEIAMTDAGIQTMLLSRAQYAEATRIARNPAGGVYDQRIGPVPDHVEATVQAAQVAEHYGIPDAARAITEAYNKGILPAEIHTDAQTNPTIIPDLIEGKIPGAYPIGTWMGEPQSVGSLPVIDAAETGRLSREASLKELDATLADQQAKLPAGDVSAQDRLNRLETVQDQLANPDITAPERKALMDRRDQILIDTNPEALKAAAQPLTDRRNIEAQRERIAGQLSDIQDERDAAQTKVAMAQQPKMQGGPSSPITGAPAAPEAAAAEPVSEVPEATSTTAPVQRTSAASARASLPPVQGGVATRLRPIEGTGEQTPMQLSQSVEEQVGRVFDSVPASRIAENDVQEAAARKFVDMAPERADQVAMNGATPPKNLLGQMVFNEVLRRADAAGDMDKVRMLATQGAQSGMLRRFGQEVQAASRLGPEGDTAAAIQQVQDARTAALKAQGVDVPKAVNDEVAAAQTITQQARTASAQPGAWADLVNIITCKE